jgi:hypothetical protein
MAIVAASFLSSSATRAAERPKDGIGPHEKIVGGGDAGVNEFPYMAALVQRGEPDTYLGQFCAATLIHPRWAVTAAHCVADETPSSIDILVGTRDLSNPGGGQRIAVVDIVTFPGFDTNTDDGDIALLLLAEPVTVIGTFARLATDPATFAPGVSSTVLGWGAATPAQDVYPSILQKVELPIVARSTAQPFYDLDGITLTDNMIFAGVAAGGKDSCSGDSGGPLLVPDGTGKFLLAGIISFGRPVACGAPDNYGAHTRIASYAPWIRSIISPNLAAWEATFAASAEAPDLDGDRAGGFLEFSGWTNPGSGSSIPVPMGGTVSVSGTTYPALTFRRLIAPSEVTYGIDFSTGLTGWLPQDSASLQVGSAQPVAGLPQMESVTLRGAAPVTANPSGFLRLSVKPSRDVIPSTRELAFPGFVAGGLSVLDSPVPPSRYQKRYRLTGLTPGVAVGLSLRSSQFDAGLTILDEGTGAVVADDTANSGGGTDDRLTFTPQAGQSYLARVTSDTLTGTGDFVLALFAPFSSLPTISGSGTTVGSLTSADPIDPLFASSFFYKDDFLLTNVSIGSFVVLRMASGAFDAFLEIVNAETGALLRSDDNSAAAGGTDAYLNFVVASNAPLLVRATSSGEFDTGAYSLTRSLGATLAVPQTLNGSLAGTDPIDPNYTQASYFRDDYYFPNLAASQSVTVSVASPTIDLYLVLVDGVTGATLLEVDDQFPGTPESFTFTHLQGDHLLLRVSSFDPQETGSYTITTSKP